MSENRVYYYARVSTGEQNLDRQIEVFKKLGAESRFIFADKQSGKNIDRPNYKLLRNNILRSGDTLIITSLDRLSRNKSDIKNELEYFKKIGVCIKVMDIPTTMVNLNGQQWVIDMVNNVIIEVISSMAEQERKTIRKRQAEGIAAAKKCGKRFGRPELKFPDNWDEVYKRWKSGELKAVQAMKIMNLKSTSFYKLKNKYEQNMEWNIPFPDNKQDKNNSDNLSELQIESQKSF